MKRSISHTSSVGVLFDETLFVDPIVSWTIGPLDGLGNGAAPLGPAAQPAVEKIVELLRYRPQR